MSPDKPVIWLINDQRIGNLNQLKAITYYLKDKFDIKECKISFSKMISLPNIINLALGTGIKFHDLSTEPDIIMSAGRRSALAAIQLKKKYPNSKIIQIMRPNLPAQYFDFIVTPKHDHYKYASYETALTANFINQDTLAKAAKQWQAEFSKIKKPILCVIIGGDTKHNKVNDQTIIKLCHNLLKIKSSAKCHLYVTTSRRTSRSNIKQIKSILNDNASLYLWEAKATHNPYLAMLSYCQAILVSVDSISMISDALATGKPVYVLEDNFGDKKHSKFVNHLKQQQLLKSSHLLFQEGLTSYKSSPINDAKKIADTIQSKISFSRGRRLG